MRLLPVAQRETMIECEALLTVPSISGLVQEVTCGASLVYTLAASQIAQRELADAAHACGGVSGCGVHNQCAVRAAGVSVDVVAPCLPVLEAALHNVQDLLRGGHRCAAQNSHYKVR